MPSRTRFASALLAGGLVLVSSAAAFAHVLAQARYRTVISGKWQLTNNLFVVHEGTSPQQAGFGEHRLWQLRREGCGSRYWGPTLVTNDTKETWGEDVFGPDLINDFVLEAIDEHAAGDPASRRPLFVYYPMALPHDPFVTTPHQPDAESNQERFAAMVAYMDHLVGRVRARLEEHELERDTLLLFIGDNGTSSRITSVRNGQQIRGGKGRSLQSGSHVPYLAWWPDTIPSGHVNETLVDVGDVFPTLVEAAAACSTWPRTRTNSRRSTTPTSSPMTRPGSRRSTPCSPRNPARSALPARGGPRAAHPASCRRPTARTCCCSSPTT